LYVCVVGSYEKLISGNYLGEITRRIIVQCAKRDFLFSGQLSDELNTSNRFYTKYVIEIAKYAYTTVFLLCFPFISVC